MSTPVRPVHHWAWNRGDRPQRAGHLPRRSSRARRPASTLTDNGKVHHPAVRRQGRPQRLEHELRAGASPRRTAAEPPADSGQGGAVASKPSRSGWPPKTLSPPPAPSSKTPRRVLQHHSHRRPHRSLAHQAPPPAPTRPGPRPPQATAPATPAAASASDRLDAGGCVTCATAGKLYHIGIGRTHARTHVLLLVRDLHIRVSNAASGNYSAHLPSTARAAASPPGAHQDPRPEPHADPANRRTPNPVLGSGSFRSLGHHIGAGEGNRTLMTSLEG